MVCIRMCEFSVAKLNFFILQGTYVFFYLAAVAVVIGKRFGWSVYLEVVLLRSVNGKFGHWEEEQAL